jgi:anti-anti-sigma regulatory factor
MPLRIRSVGACVILALPPIVDRSHIAEARAPLHGEFWERSPRPEVVILDLSPVQFIDSPGVALINETRQQGRVHGIGVRVVAATPAQRSILVRLGVDEEVLYSSLPQALVCNSAERAGVEDDGGSQRPVGAADQVLDGRPKIKGEGSQIR